MSSNNLIEYDTLKTYHNRYFSADYIKNNPLLIYISSPTASFNVLNNYTLVQGSIKLKQSLCSESYFLWGGCNASRLSFECCSHELIDKAPDGEIELKLTPTRYENGVLVEVLESESVILFTGYIEKAEKTSIPGNYKITAYDNLYRMRNVKISDYLQSKLDESSELGLHLSWGDIALYVENRVGFYNVNNPSFFNSIYFPDNANITSMNGIDLLKEFAFFNQSFGMVNGNGDFEFVKVDTEVDAVLNNHYYCINTYDIDDLSYSDGYIWQPHLFQSEPMTNIFKTTTTTTTEDDYYNNVYIIKNSPLLGDNEWLNTLYECDEYGAPASKYNNQNLPAGLFDTDNLNIPSNENYVQQEYSIRVYGVDPTIPLGSRIFVHKFVKGTGWERKVTSYLMERTLRILSPQLIEGTYSANNAPYNSVKPAYEDGVMTATRICSRLRQDLPYLSDGSKVSKFKALRSLSKAEYDAIQEKRDDTIYYVYE